MSFPKVNAHLHTPFSFSAFCDISDALDRAVAEEVKAVGINDFYTAEGYGEWAEGCRQRALYPLFGIEFISLNEEDQKAGLRVNDPGNPGRTYISGRVVTPFRLDEPMLRNWRTCGPKPTSRWRRCVKVERNSCREAGRLTLDIGGSGEPDPGIRSGASLAKALRLKVYEQCSGDSDRIKVLLKELFDGKELRSDTDNVAGVEMRSVETC